MTKEVELTVKEKHKAHNRYRKDKSQANLNVYRQARNNATRATREARLHYEANLANNIKDNPKEFWAYVKSQTGSTSGVSPLLKGDGSLAIDAKDKASTLNDFFVSVFTKENIDHIPAPQTEDFDSALSDILLTEESICKEIKTMKAGSSAGPASIHPRILKETDTAISKPLSVIFNISMKEGSLPMSWKEAIVVPIYKKGSRSEPGNYRPVSLTSTCGKLMERIVRRHILEHVESNNIFSEKQHGFRSGRSCSTQLLSVMEDWTRLLDDQVPFDCIYLDYKKAFDSVPHQRLLKKAEACGINSNLLKWIESFLSGRKQCVRVESALSDWADVTSGIPQGSVLGPTLFLLFINDLPSVVSSCSALFADDTKVYSAVSSPDDSDRLQQDINALNEWSECWQLPFNESKCKLIHYGRNNPKYSYKIGNTVIAEVMQEKDLGVTFDPALSFSTHHDMSIAKANSRIGLMRRTFKHLEPKPFLQLYKAIVRPVVEYCSVITNPVFKRDEDRLEKVQRRATKLVSGMADLPYEDRLRQLKLQSLKHRRRRTDVLQIYRIINGIDRVEASHMLIQVTDSRTRSNGYKLFKKHCQTKIRANSFSQRAIDTWNSLPTSVVEAPTLNRFKSALRKHWSLCACPFNYP